MNLIKTLDDERLSVDPYGDTAGYRDLYRDSLRAALSDNESLRGKLCRARELKGSILIERISDLPPREWMMRPSDRDTRDWFGEMDHVLESPPSPCRHEERVKELEENIWQLRPLVRNMEDMPKEFQEIINTHFWELLLDNSTAE